MATSLPPLMFSKFTYVPPMYLLWCGLLYLNASRSAFTEQLLLHLNIDVRQCTLALIQCTYPFKSAEFLQTLLNLQAVWTWEHSKFEFCVKVKRRRECSMGRHSICEELYIFHVSTGNVYSSSAMISRFTRGTIQKHLRVKG